MKTCYKISLYILLGITILSACKKDFLNINPKGVIIPETISDYDMLMNSNKLYYYPYTWAALIPVLMGDEVSQQTTYFTGVNVHTQRAFKWEADIYDPAETASDLTDYLNNLYSCNKIIAEVMQAKLGTEQQKKSLLAEARATRAWIYFQFINYYGKPYNPSTAAKDEGFPILTKNDVTATQFSRASVEEVYNFMIADLQAAIPDLPIQNKIATRMSRPAAEGMLGKVYLFMGRFPDALPFFRTALADLSVASNPPVLYDYNVEFGANGSFLPIGLNGPNYPGNNYNDFTESVLAKTFSNGPGYGNPFGNEGLLVSTQTISLFTASDLRLKLYSNKNSDGSPTVGGLRKYAVTTTKFGLQLADLYLLSAECKARTNDLPGAILDLETLRKKRMPLAEALVSTDIAGNQNRLIRFIIDERTREFAAEGYRWFDMRRLSVDPLFSNVTYVHTVAGSAETYTLSQPNRFVLRFPQSIIDANPGMPNNP